MVTEESAKDTVKTIAQGMPAADSNGRRNTTLSLMPATRQALPLVFSSRAFFSAGH